MSLTDEMVTQLKKEIQETSKQIKFWKSTTPQEQFLDDLDGINE